MNFAQAINNESRKTYTENGATAYNSTGSALLDFFGSAGALRVADEERIKCLFADAIKEDPLLAAKALFYTRDVRGGLGERRTFRILLKYAAEHHPEIIASNLWAIGEYGRYDDLYELVGTSLESDMWAYVKNQLVADENAMQNNEPCSLLAKWLKTADASSEKTRKMGIMTAQKLGMSVYEYKRRIRKLRKYTDVTEVKMSGQKWNQINYSAVPSKAMMNYGRAFARHDAERYQEFISKAAKGEVKINASTLYPYDLIEKYIGDWYSDNLPYDAAIEAQWNALPDFVGQEANAIVIADTSGSMWGRPLCSALGLTIYFAQRNKGAFHNLWMSFSGDSKVQILKGETLAQQLASIDMDHWGGNTNLELAFMNILKIARDNHVPPEEMVKSLIVISDMEIDQCTSSSWSFYDEMRDRFARYGYEIPNVVFWNVESRHDIFHADKNRKGVQLCSGQSPSMFRQLMKSIGMTPMEMMLSVLNSERYALIQIDR